MKKTLVAFFLFTCSVFYLPSIAQCDGDTLTDHQRKMMEAFHLVQPTDIYEWTEVLVSDAYRGRRSGDIGYDMAADYVMDYFKEWGIKPKGDNGTYENTFAQRFNDVKGEGYYKMLVPMGKDTLVKNYICNKEYFPTAQSDNGEVTGEVIYVGYGINAPELKYNDYKGLDLRGKIVLIQGTYPYKGDNLDTIQMWSKYQRAAPKIAAAVEAGAAGVIYVSRFADPTPRQADGAVVTFVSEDTANDLLVGTGKNLKEWRESTFDKFKGKAVPTGKIVSMGAENEFFPDRTTANIVGIIEGSDPVLKNEYIIIGGHLDHIGMLPIIHPGAQDNVSGSVITMAVAKALAQSGVDMKRSVVFVLFAAEELGVLGAAHFLETMPFPKENVACMVNLDMLATGNGMCVHGAEEWAYLVPYFCDASQNWARRPFEPRLTPWEFKTRFFTDGNAFWNHKIPTFELKLTGGVWPAPYHVPEDTIDQLDPVIMADAARALTIATINIANSTTAGRRQW